MEPTAEQLQGMNTLGTIMNWVPLPAGALSDAFLAASGLTLASLPRLVAAIPLDEFDEFLTLTLGDVPVPLTPAQKSQIRLTGATCRLAAGLTITMEQQRATAAAEAAFAATAAATAREAQLAAAASAPTAANTGERKIKISTILDQTSDAEAPALNEADVLSAFERYASRIGGTPPPDEEVTGDQLSALQSLVKARLVPYADFALFGPYGLRIRRKLVLSGLIISTDGILKQVELKGPPLLQDWIRCYRVLRTALIMLGEVTPGALDAYERQICRYHERYGPSIWVLLYQADVRMRLEHMERLRRIGQSKAPADFDAAKPWEWVWQESLRDLAFWRLRVRGAGHPGHHALTHHELRDRR